MTYFWIDESKNVVPEAVPQFTSYAELQQRLTLPLLRSPLFFILLLVPFCYFFPPVSPYLSTTGTDRRFSSLCDIRKRMLSLALPPPVHVEKAVLYGPLPCQTMFKDRENVPGYYPPRVYACALVSFHI